MASQRIAVIGSTGQLGTDLVEVLRLDDKGATLPLSHADCDCTNANQVGEMLHKLHPDVVINCAAYVRVDDCEDHAREAFAVNAIGALNVARACAAVEALCVYISTDYVFDGGKGSPYVESDPTRPINVYGASKLAGEHLVQQAAPHSLIVRTSSLFGKTGARGKGGNFVETIVAKAKAGETLRVVNDMRMSPTYARDAATALVELIKTKADGIVHLTNGGACTWYELAKQIVDIMGLRAAIDPVSSKEYPTRARRPENSALRSEHAAVGLRSWQDGVRAYLFEKGYGVEPGNPRLADGGRRSFVIGH
jgi:dTDP-4-dehydrorhamnose reductase